MRIAQVAPLYESVPPQALRRHRARRLLPDRGARPPGARRHAVRERRLGDARAARARCARARCGSTARRVDAARAPRAACSSRCSQRARRVRRHPLPHRLPALPAGSRAAATPHVTTLHGRLDLPDLAPLYRRVPRHAARLDLRRAARAAAACATGWRPSTTACRATCYTLRARAAATTSRSSAASRRRSASTARSRSRARAGHAAARSRPRSTAADRDYFETEIAAAARRIPLVEFVGEIGEAREGRVPRRRARAAVPDRLAGAVRPRDDRGDGVRHAGRSPSRRGSVAGGGRATASPASSSTSVDEAVAAVARSRDARPPRACRDSVRAALHRRRGWRATTLRCLRAASLGTRRRRDAPSAAEP